MKILTISTEFPYPADDGTKIQTFERVRALSCRHNVTLLCVSSEEISPDRLREMERYCRCVLIARAPLKPSVTAPRKVYQMLRSVYLQEPHHIHDRISAEAQAWLDRKCRRQEFDVIEAEGYATAYLRSCHGALRVAIFHSVTDTFARRQEAFTDGPVRRITNRIYTALNHKYEAGVSRSADLCVALTEEMRADFQRLHPSAHVRNCLSVGVDLEYFAYEPPSQPPEGACFVGRMDYTPNVDAVSWFCRAVLPLVRREVPRFRFSIIGSRPTEEAQALALDPAVTVTGYVDDIRPHVRRSGILVLPTRMGGGILNKMLQGLALGVPVIATSLCLEGLQVVPGRDMLLADKPEDLARNIVRLTSDDALRLKLASHGRAYVEMAHQWSAMASRYEAELLVCLNDRKFATGNIVSSPASSPQQS